jgi:superfamily II DNA helicase RecQ
VTGSNYREANASPSPDSRSPTEHSPQIVEAVRIVLSGAARMKGRFGKQMLARMLIGSKAKELSKGGLDRLSTYGLLAKLKESEAMLLIDALLAARLLMQVEETPHRPLIRLTPRGEEVMKGSAELTERLNLDKRLASRLQPIERSAESPRRAIHAPAPKVNHVDAPHYWTCRVLASGFTAEECCQIRGLSHDELQDQLLRAAQDGQPVDPRWVLSSAQIASLDEVLKRISGSQLSERLSTLPAGVNQRQARLYLLTRSQAKRD